MNEGEVLKAHAEAVADLVAELRGEVARLERANRGLVMFILRDYPDADLEAITGVNETNKREEIYKEEIARLIEENQGLQETIAWSDAEIDDLEDRIKKMSEAVRDIYVCAAQACAAFQEHKRSGESIEYWASEAMEEATKAKKIRDEVLAGGGENQ